MTPRPAPPRLWQRLAYLAAVYALFVGCYGFVNARVSLAGARDLSLPLDRATPFVADAIYPFGLVYVLLVVPAFLLRSRALLARTTLGFAVQIVVSCALFVALPVAVPRPPRLPPSLAGRLVAALYRADRPVCGFPSLHVSCSLLAALALRHERPQLWLAFLGAALATTLSVLLVKQHVLLDVVGGAALALVCDRLLIAHRRTAAPSQIPG
jgi:membrane-associated phospholipid phosphatase